MTADRLVIGWDGGLDPTATATATVVDGRTGLYLTRSAADEVLEARVAAEARPWSLEDVQVTWAEPLTRESLEAIQARINETLEDLAVGTFRARVDTPRQRLVMSSSGQPCGQSVRHPVDPSGEPASPPPPTPACATPGSLGRHPVPAGAGVRSCPCGAVTRHPAP